jgi:D-amino-acid dehydrogenase
MHIVVLGAGVIGTTTAYYLARAGQQVTVIDRQPGPGLETSFANGGLVTPSMSDPWAAPGIPLKLLKWVGREEAPFLLRLRAVPGLAGWGLAFLRNCARARWQQNTESVLQLALFGRDSLDALTAEERLVYDRNDQGTLRIYRDRPAMQAAEAAGSMYEAMGLPYRLLDARDCLALEPALAPIGHELVGAIHYPDDRSGDAFLFTEALAARCRDLGVAFRFQTSITGLALQGDAVGSVVTSAGSVPADAVVLALGSYSRALARQIGITLPVYPVKGYSATLDLGGWNAAPSIPIVDDLRKVAVTRLGDRIRLAGTAEFTGFDTRLNARRGDMLLRGAVEVLPELPRGLPVRHWSGLRPMTPDGRPLIGPTRYKNLFVNTGHGPLGWTLACGSARLLTALMLGETTAVDPAAFAPSRR